MSHENRLSYCDHVHRKTGGCVCKNHPDKLPKCESILNLPENIRTPVIAIAIDDQSRDTASLLREKVQAQMRMRRHDLEIEKLQGREIPMTIIVDEIPRPTEGILKSWHKLIKPNHRKKPR